MYREQCGMKECKLAEQGACLPGSCTNLGNRERILGHRWYGSFGKECVWGGGRGGEWGIGRLSVGYVVKMSTIVRIV